MFNEQINDGNCRAISMEVFKDFFDNELRY